MPLLLAIDTVGPALSVALAEGGDLVATRAETVERGQAELILPLIEATLAEAGVAWRGLDMVAATVGPGGFTAIRTGVAVARALALALDRPAVPVGTLEAVAEAAAHAAGPGPLLALKDLRRDRLAAQVFVGDDMAPAGGPALLEWAEALAAAATAPRLAGDGAATLRESLPPGKPTIEAAPAAKYVAAAAWRRAGRGEAPVAGTELRPLYLRPADARPAAGRPLVAALIPAAT